MPVPYSSGWQRLTASGVVGVSGQPILFSGYTFESSGTAAIPYFLHGSTTAGSQVARGASGVANAPSPVIPVGQLPVMLANGLYVSFDANTSAVTVFYTQG